MEKYNFSDGGSSGSIEIEEGSKTVVLTYKDRYLGEISYKVTGEYGMFITVEDATDNPRLKDRDVLKWLKEVILYRDQES